MVKFYVFTIFQLFFSSETPYTSFLNTLAIPQLGVLKGFSCRVSARQSRFPRLRVGQALLFWQNDPKPRTPSLALSNRADGIDGAMDQLASLGQGPPNFLNVSPVSQAEGVGEEKAVKGVFRQKIHREIRSNKNYSLDCIF